MFLFSEQSASSYVKFAAKESKGSKSKQPFFYFVNEGDGCRVLWKEIFLFFAAQFFGIFCLFTMVSNCRWNLFIFANAMNIFGGFGVTGGVHRLWSHKAYSARWPFRVLLMVMFTTTEQHTIWSWCEFHRVHHKYTDTDADPHNTKRGMTFAHIGWQMMRMHPEFYEKLSGVDMSDLASDPIVMFQKKYYWPLHVLCAVTLPAAIPVIFWGEPPLMALMATLFTIGLNLHLSALINSASHLFGDRPFKANTPGENPATSIFCLGEGYHNYHHAFPRDYAAAELGSTFNVTKVVIDLMARVGQTYDLKRTSRSVVSATRAKKIAASSAHGHSHAHEEAPEEDYETVRSSKSA